MTKRSADGTAACLLDSEFVLFMPYRSPLLQREPVQSKARYLTQPM